MAAVAQKTAKWDSDVASYRSRSIYGVRKSRSRTLRMTVILVGSVLLLLAFAYVALSANCLVQGRKYTDLMQEQRELKIQNERLRLRLDALNAPDKITGAAAKAGMVYAKQYEYLGGTSRMAKAPETDKTND